MEGMEILNSRIRIEIVGTDSLQYQKLHYFLMIISLFFFCHLSLISVDIKEREKFLDEMKKSNDIIPEIKQVRNKSKN